MVDKRTKSVIQIVRGKSCWRDSDRNGPKAVAICPNREEPSGFIFLKWPFWLQEDLVWPVNKVELPKKSKPLPLQPRLDEEGQIRCDRIDRGLLLTKLNVSGMCGHELDLLRNYLSGRK